MHIQALFKISPNQGGGTGETLLNGRRQRSISVYYEQNEVKIKKDDLAESSVLF